MKMLSYLGKTTERIIHKHLDEEAEQLYTITNQLFKFEKWYEVELHSTKL